MREMDDGKLEQPPTISFTAASGALCFLAAAVVMWMFTPPVLLPAASLSVHWQYFGYHHGSRPAEIPSLSLPRPTVSLFGKQVDLSRASLLHGTTFDHWAHRSYYTFPSLIGESGNRLSMDFTAIPTCQLRGDGKWIHGLSASDSAATPPLAFSQAQDLWRQDPSARTLCAFGWLDVSGTLSLDFQQFFAPNASLTKAELEVQIGEVEQAPHYAVSQRFWVQLDGSMTVAIIGNYSIPFHTLGYQHRHAKFFLSEPPMSKFEGITKANVSVVTLQPGDILAIPAYAIVTAIATTNSSISLKLTSMNAAERVINDITGDLPLARWIDEIPEESDLSYEQAAHAIAKRFLSEPHEAFRRSVLEEGKTEEEKAIAESVARQLSLSTENAAADHLKEIAAKILKQRYPDASGKATCATHKELPSDTETTSEIDKAAIEMSKIMALVSKEASEEAWMNLVNGIANIASRSGPESLLRCWSL